MLTMFDRIVRLAVLAAFNDAIVADAEMSIVLCWWPHPAVEGLSEHDPASPCVNVKQCKAS